MSEDSTQQNLCGAQTADGTPCQRRVKPGSGPCAWHTKTLSRKIRAWARNDTLSFILILFFGVAGVIGTCGWVYDEFFKVSAPGPLDRPAPPEAVKPPASAPPSRTSPKNKKSPNGSPPPAFAVAIELKLLVPGPMKDEAGTGFWGVSTYGGKCFLRSADVVMLIRIKSLETTKTMITAYNVYTYGREMNRIKMTTSKPVQILARGVIPSGFAGRLTIPLQAPSGNLGGGFVHVAFKDSDFSVAAPLQGDILDEEIADHYLEPGDTVRGWSFFEYPAPGTIPAKLTVKISDDLGHTYSYDIPDEAGNPTGDALRREITVVGPTMNLSSCIRQPHPTP